MENPTRRRLLVAGLAGTAATALVGQRASATAPTEPPSTDASSIEPGSSEPTSAPPTAPGRPTDADVTLLGFAQQLELTARDLYQLAIDEGAAGSEDRVLLACHKKSWTINVPIASATAVCLLACCFAARSRIRSHVEMLKPNSKISTTAVNRPATIGSRRYHFITRSGALAGRA